jgi:peroxiredoxin (alkyl hydroperoxide reductase subunit C)
LGLNSQAPDFTARSTQGEITLSDYRGRWVLLFSHPADFTPVCTSEFIAFQTAKLHFDELDCSLIGLSIDSLYSHIAWIRDIETSFGISITFPIVEDVSMAVSTAYGMLHENSSNTATVRSVFFIDPDGVVRALVHYPNQVGRSVDELLRVLSALQQADKCQVSTPEGWQPGDVFVLPPPESQHMANERVSSESAAWYMTTTEQNE